MLTDRLPVLVFGNARSSVEHDIARYSQRLAQVVTSLQYYESAGAAAEFRSKTCFVSINGMRLVANANTPVRVAVGDSPDLTLMIPFVGENLTIAEGKAHPWRAGESAMLCPAIGRGGEGGVRSNLNMDLRLDRLQTTARAMLGLADDQWVPLGIENAHTVPMNFGSANFSTLLRQHCQTIDSLIDTPAVLAQLGVDEALYRIVVMMLRPDLFLPAPEGKRHHATSNKRRRIDLVCDFIRARLDDTVTLTDLERISGMSRRSLQMAFQERYQCTPMQWVTEQKLLMAHAQLRNAKPGETVTSIAIAYFPNLGEFAQRYKQRFGEQPSTTLARAFRI